MVSRKYIKDYQLSEQVDVKGRVKSKAVYIGGEYTLSPPVSQGDKRLILILSVLSCLLYFIALIPITHAARLVYVILPFAFSILPIFLLTEKSVSLLREKETMTRRKAEKISNRLPSCSMIATILLVAAFLGFIITAAAAWKDFLAGDIIFGALSLILAVAMIIIYSKCFKLKAIANDTIITR